MGIDDRIVLQSAGIFIQPPYFETKVCPAKPK